MQLLYTKTTKSVTEALVIKLSYYVALWHFNNTANNTNIHCSSVDDT